MKEQTGQALAKTTQEASCGTYEVRELTRRDEYLLALANIDAPSAVEVYAPKRISEMKTTTPRQVLELVRKHEVGTIRRFSADNKTRTAAMIKSHLIKLNTTCDVRRPLREEQIEFIVEAVINDYALANLTMVDFMVVMRRAAMGQYGDMFESLTPPKVLGWLKKYADERAEEAGNMSREENERYKGDATRSRQRKEDEWEREMRARHDFALEQYKQRHNVNNTRE